MAQMKYKRLAAALCALLVAGGVSAAEPPAAGIAAEGRGDWAAAAQVYRAQLQAHPDDAALWQRLSDVEAKQGQATAAATALDHAAALQPQDAELQATAAHAWSVAQQPQKALAAIGRALALAPDNVDYLLAQSQLANWAGNYPLAEQSLERVHQLAPQRTDVLAATARSKAWQGDLSAAIRTMRTYLAAHPDDKDARLDLARFLAWRGDYPAAADVLSDYRQRFGSSDNEQALLARVYAWAGWRHHALAANTPLLEAAPDNYERNYTQALATLASAIPRAALPYTAAAERLQPGTKETADLRRVTDARTASFVELPFVHSWDSQGISIDHAQALFDFGLRDATTLLLDASGNRYRARAGSAFTAADGSDEVNETRLRAGVRQALNADYAIEGWVGVSHFDTGGGNTGIGSVALFAQPSDTWRWQAQLERDRVGVSPLAASLGLSRNGGVIEGWWTPDLRWTLDAYARHDNYSDNNQRDEAAFALRRATVRNGWLNLDLGVAGQWFGFEHRLNDGYYSPTSYRRFALTAAAYFSLSERVGLQIQAALGRQRDETFSGWRRANDISGNLVIGIDSPWQLSLHTGYSQRILESGAYAGHTWGATLTRRF